MFPGCPSFFFSVCGGVKVTLSAAVVQYLKLFWVQQVWHTASTGPQLPGAQSFSWLNPQLNSVTSTCDIYKLIFSPKYLLVTIIQNKEGCEKLILITGKVLLLGQDPVIRNKPVAGAWLSRKSRAASLAVNMKQAHWCVYLAGSRAAHLCPQTRDPAHHVPRMTVQQETCQFTANKGVIVRI